MVTLGDLGFDLGPRGALHDAAVPTVSMPAPSSTAAASPEAEQGSSPGTTGTPSGLARPRPVPLFTGTSTMSYTPEICPTSPAKSMHDASARLAAAPIAGRPWNSPGAPPGNLSPVHGAPPGNFSTAHGAPPGNLSPTQGAPPGNFSPTHGAAPPGNFSTVNTTSLAARATSLREACAMAMTSAYSRPVTPGPQSPQFCSDIMSTQPISQSQRGELDESADGVSPENSAVPVWSPAGTPQADVLRSWLHASGLHNHADLADQLRAAAPEIYED